LVTSEIRNLATRESVMGAGVRWPSAELGQGSPPADLGQGQLTFVW